MEEIAKLLTDCHNSFKDTESARILSFYRSRDNRLTFDERLQVINEVENAYSPVYMELKHLNPALTDWDCMLCVLSYEGFPVAVISECFAVSKDAVRMRKSRIREKLPAEWFALCFHTITSESGSKCHNSVTDEISEGENTALLLSEKINTIQSTMRYKILMTFVYILSVVSIVSLWFGFCYSYEPHKYGQAWVCLQILWPVSTIIVVTLFAIKKKWEMKNSEKLVR